MRRSPRVVLAWIGAALVALVTARVVGNDLATLHQRARSLGADVPVVLAARDLPLGTTVTAGDVHVVTRPASTVARDALHDSHTAIGRVVSVALLQDDVVRTRHLAAAGRGIDGVVPAGRRAVHVAAKDGYRPPAGSVIDVYASFDPANVSAATPPGRAETVATGAQVLADDADSHDAESGDSQSAGVTLLVTETEAQAVANAAALGQVTFALAPPETACCTSSAS